MKEKIVNDKAVYYIERAVYLICQWLNEHTDVSYELYDLLDNDETGIRYSLKQKQHPYFAGSSLAQMRANPHPLFYQRKEKTHGEKTDRANESSYDSRGKVDDI